MTTRNRKLEYERACRLHNLAASSQAAGHAIRPEKLYLRSLAIKERMFGAQHLEVGLTLNNLGLYYKSLGRLADARLAYQRALEILQAEFGSSHPNVAGLLYNMAQLLRKESELLEQRAQMIDEAVAELADPAWQDKRLIRQELAAFRLRAAPSRIHRFGVFADEPIPAGTRIIEYTGERVSRREWMKRSGRRTYLFHLNKYWGIDGSAGGSGAELVNHSCEPNAKLVIEGDRVWIASLRDIEANEELLLDYRFPKDAVRTPCYCGAPACRGTINIA